MKRATAILIKVNSWNALSSMLLVCISILVYIKSVLRNKILILDASGHCIDVNKDDPCLILEPKRGPRSKKLWEILAWAHV